MKTSESIANIAKALSGFQSEVKQPEKDGTNPHFKSKYVTLFANKGRYRKTITP
ncbi:ERF family protein [Peribacillus butanolivorans]|uniref:hypothetical protein n=1 Tax=Peribacillus butanolivorans TaxID=421767 RepID=UPI003659A7E4